MPRASNTWKQDDATRAARAAIDAGLEVYGIEITSGRIFVVTKACSEARSELDQELAEFEAHHGQGSP